MKLKSSKFFKIIVIALCFFMVFEQSGFAQVAGELDISGHFLALRNSFIQDRFRPLHLRYLSYNPSANNFNLLLDKGDSLKGLSPKGTDPKESLQQETKTLLNYFFIGISLPNEAFWVNLRPDAEDNIIDRELAETDVGKIFLEADLQLKKDTANFTSPQAPEGKDYWDKLYKKAEELYGSENITIPTLTRPWIVPDEIIIRESSDNAYIYKATLKVMLEQDYLKDSSTYNFKDERSEALNEYSSQLIRETIIPKLTKEINSSKRYAPLRQVYYSLILAQWFKQKFYGKSGVYSYLIDRHNLNGLTSEASWSKTTYFNAYKTSFQQGEYNIKEPRYTPYGQTIRSYMSGGISFGTEIKNQISSPILSQRTQPITPVYISSLIKVVGSGEVGDPFHNLEINMGGLPVTETSATSSPEKLKLNNLKENITVMEVKKQGGKTSIRISMPDIAQAIDVNVTTLPMSTLQKAIRVAIEKNPDKAQILEAFLERLLTSPPRQLLSFSGVLLPVIVSEEYDLLAFNFSALSNSETLINAVENISSLSINGSSPLRSQGTLITQRELSQVYWEDIALIAAELIGVSRPLYSDVKEGKKTVAQRNFELKVIIAKALERVSVDLTRVARTPNEKAEIEKMKKDLIASTLFQNPAQLDFAIAMAAFVEEQMVGNGNDSYTNVFLPRDGALFFTLEQILSILNGQKRDPRLYHISRATFSDFYDWMAEEVSKAADSNTTFEDSIAALIKAIEDKMSQDTKFEAQIQQIKADLGALGFENSENVRFVDTGFKTFPMMLCALMKMKDKDIKVDRKVKGLVQVSSLPSNILPQLNTQKWRMQVRSWISKIRAFIYAKPSISYSEDAESFLQHPFEAGKDGSMRMLAPALQLRAYWIQMLFVLGAIHCHDMLHDMETELVKDGKTPQEAKQTAAEIIKKLYQPMGLGGLTAKDIISQTENAYKGQLNEDYSGLKSLLDNLSQKITWDELRSNAEYKNIYESFIEKSTSDLANIYEISPLTAKSFWDTLSEFSLSPSLLNKNDIKNIDASIKNAQVKNTIKEVLGKENGLIGIDWKKIEQIIIKPFSNNLFNLPQLIKKEFDEGINFKQIILELKPLDLKGKIKKWVKVGAAIMMMVLFLNQNGHIADKAISPEVAVPDKIIELVDKPKDEKEQKEEIKPAQPQKEETPPVVVQKDDNLWKIIKKLAQQKGVKLSNQEIVDLVKNIQADNKDKIEKPDLLQPDWQIVIKAVDKYLKEKSPNKDGSSPIQEQSVAASSPLKSIYQRIFKKVVPFEARPLPSAREFFEKLYAHEHQDQVREEKVQKALANLEKEGKEHLEESTRACLLFAHYLMETFDYKEGDLWARIELILEKESPREMFEEFYHFAQQLKEIDLYSSARDRILYYLRQVKDYKEQINTFLTINQRLKKLGLEGRDKAILLGLVSFDEGAYSVRVQFKEFLAMLDALEQNLQRSDITVILSAIGNYDRYYYQAVRLTSRIMNISEAITKQGKAEELAQLINILKKTEVSDGNIKIALDEIFKADDPIATLEAIASDNNQSKVAKIIQTVEKTWFANNPFERPRSFYHAILAAMKRRYYSKTERIMHKILGSLFEVNNFEIQLDHLQDGEFVNSLVSFFKALERSGGSLYEINKFVGFTSRSPDANAMLRNLSVALQTVVSQGLNRKNNKDLVTALMFSLAQHPSRIAYFLRNENCKPLVEIIDGLLSCKWYGSYIENIMPLLVQAEGLHEIVSPIAALAQRMSDAEWYSEEAKDLLLALLQPNKTGAPAENISAMIELYDFLASIGKEKSEIKDTLMGVAATFHPKAKADEFMEQETYQSIESLTATLKGARSSYHYNEDKALIKSVLATSWVRQTAEAVAHFLFVLPTDTWDLRKKVDLLIVLTREENPPEAIQAFTGLVLKLKTLGLGNLEIVGILLNLSPAQQHQATQPVMFLAEEPRSRVYKPAQGAKSIDMMIDSMQQLGFDNNKITEAVSKIASSYDPVQSAEAIVRLASAIEAQLVNNRDFYFPVFETLFLFFLGNNVPTQINNFLDNNGIKIFYSLFSTANKISPRIGSHIEAINKLTLILLKSDSNLQAAKNVIASRSLNAFISLLDTLWIQGFPETEKTTIIDTLLVPGRIADLKSNAVAFKELSEIVLRSHGVRGPLVFYFSQHLKPYAAINELLFNEDMQERKIAGIFYEMLAGSDKQGLRFALDYFAREGLEHLPENGSDALKEIRRRNIAGEISVNDVMFILGSSNNQSAEVLKTAITVFQPQLQQYVDQVTEAMKMLKFPQFLIQPVLFGALNEAITQEKGDFFAAIRHDPDLEASLLDYLGVIAQLNVVQENFTQLLSSMRPALKPFVEKIKTSFIMLNSPAFLHKHFFSESFADTLIQKEGNLLEAINATPVVKEDFFHFLENSLVIDVWPNRMEMLLEVFQPALKESVPRLHALLNALPFRHNFLIRDILAGDLNEVLFVSSEENFTQNLLENKQISKEVKLKLLTHLYGVEFIPPLFDVLLMTLTSNIDDIDVFGRTAEVIGKWFMESQGQLSLPAEVIANMRKVVSGEMDIDDPWHLFANYLVLARDLEIAKLKRVVSYRELYDVIERVKNGQEDFSTIDVPEDAMLNIRALAYEAFLMRNKILIMQQRAKTLGKQMIVVANMSYGGVAVAPITEERQGQTFISGENIPVWHTKVGSTESHNNEFVLLPELFSEEQIKVLLAEQPFIAVVDGTTSVASANRSSPHVPDAYKGYRNYLIVLNQALFDSVNPADFEVDEEFVHELIRTSEAQELLQKIKGIGLSIKPRAPNQEYNLKFWYERKKSITKEEYLHFRKGKKPTQDYAEKITDDQIALLEAPTCVFMQSAIHPEDIDQKIKEDFIGGNPSPAYFDDRDHFKQFYLDYEEGYGVVFSKRYVYVARKAFREFMQDQGLPLFDKTALAKQYRPIETVVLDLDGTLTQKTGAKVSNGVAQNINALLESGIRVVIMTDDIEENVLSRLSNLKASPSLIVFTDGGARGYTFNSDGSKSDFNEYNEKNMFEIQERDKILALLARVNEKMPQAEGRLGAVSPYRIELKDIRDRTKFIGRIKDSFDQEGITAKVYKFGRHGLRITFQHKEHAMESLSGTYRLDKSKILIVADSARSHQIDRALLTALPDAVSVNAGKFSPTIGKENPNIVQFDRGGVGATTMLLSNVLLFRGLPDYLIIPSSIGQPIDNEEQDLKAAASSLEAEAKNNNLSAGSPVTDNEVSATVLAQEFNFGRLINQNNPVDDNEWIGIYLEVEFWLGSLERWQRNGDAFRECGDNEKKIENLRITIKEGGDLSAVRQEINNLGPEERKGRIIERRNMDQEIVKNRLRDFGWDTETNGAIVKPTAYGSPITTLDKVSGIATEVSVRFDPKVANQCVPASRLISAELNKLGIRNEEREIHIPYDASKDVQRGDSATSHTVLEAVFDGEAWVIDTQLLQFTLPDRNKLRVPEGFVSERVYRAEDYYKKVLAFADSICMERITKAEIISSSPVKPASFLVGSEVVREESRKFGLGSVLQKQEKVGLIGSNRVGDYKFNLVYEGEKGYLVKVQGKTEMAAEMRFKLYNLADGSKGIFGENVFVHQKHQGGMYSNILKAIIEIGEKDSRSITNITEITGVINNLETLQSLYGVIIGSRSREESEEVKRLSNVEEENYYEHTEPLLKIFKKAIIEEIKSGRNFEEILPNTLLARARSGGGFSENVRLELDEQRPGEIILKSNRPVQSVGLATDNKQRSSSPAQITRVQEEVAYYKQLKENGPLVFENNTWFLNETWSNHDYDIVPRSLTSIDLETLDTLENELGRINAIFTRFDLSKVNSFGALYAYMRWRLSPKRYGIKPEAAIKTLTNIIEQARDGKEINVAFTDPLLTQILDKAKDLVEESVSSPVEAKKPGNAKFEMRPEEAARLIREAAAENYRKWCLLSERLEKGTKRILIRIPGRDSRGGSEFPLGEMAATLPILIKALINSGKDIEEMIVQCDSYPELVEALGEDNVKLADPSQTTDELRSIYSPDLVIDFDTVALGEEIPEDTVKFPVARLWMSPDRIGEMCNILTSANLTIPKSGEAIIRREREKDGQTAIFVNPHSDSNKNDNVDFWVGLIQKLVSKGYKVVLNSGKEGGIDQVHTKDILEKLKKEVESGNVEEFKGNIRDLLNTFSKKIDGVITIDSGIFYVVHNLYFLPTVVFTTSNTLGWIPQEKEELLFRRVEYSDFKDSSTAVALLQSLLEKEKEVSASSLVRKDMGGIDMRSLPKYTKVEQAGSSLKGRPLSTLGGSLVSNKEWLEIERMANSGIAPSCERLREYLLSLQDPNSQIDKVLVCIADILRQEEEKACYTEASLREILVLLESGKPVNELRLALAKVQVLAKEPQLIVQ